MTQSLRCDICGIGYTGNGRTGKVVRHYRLLRYQPHDPADPPTNAKRPTRGREIGAGSLDMCDDCWDRIGKPGMVPQRSHPRWGNQHGKGER
jgi:hypothetical protein